ncbi:hypothetical protein Mal64_04730 [Pseudobythopirellula maris]|uniref:Stigma-specific protein, Stig1 n=1 Tax=Pseudobythopirellula maris TaxID=2527991 RepID=A0A5C5ZS15_9BACT|nr:DUF6666 family protein [Pseudobythopirellula maris]TWT90090.1 hypothetical protein Mal64_04730 [Pseudobythopirellula maris]
MRHHDPSNRRAAPAATLLLALAITPVVGFAATEAAGDELAWQSSGVRQASHTAASSTAPAAKRPTAQAPADRTTAQRPAAQAHSTQRVASAAPKRTAAPQTVAPSLTASANASLATLASAGVNAAHLDPAVTQAGLFHHGGYGGGCGCGASCGCGDDCGCGPVCEPGCGCEEATCGVPYYEEPSCGYTEPGCGAGCGDACGCGDYGDGCAVSMGSDCVCGDVGCCGECGCGDSCGCAKSLGGCIDRGAVPLVLCVPPIKDISLFSGVHGFKNPLDGTRDQGNFGFHEGLNIGGKMAWLPLPRLGYQIGGQAVHSQLHGTLSPGTDDSHTQAFFTAGLFHRKKVGMQYGVVYDMLRDERLGSEDYNQVRGLISITNPRGKEVGFEFSTHVSETQTAASYFRTVDQYLLFWRLHGKGDGEFRCYGGFSDQGDGIVGGDIHVPLAGRWSFESGFRYLIPENADAANGVIDEAWNLGMNLVWNYGSGPKRRSDNIFRPMFSVADNSSLIVDRRP